MPSITDVSKRKNSFAKKAYRAWSFNSNDRTSTEIVDNELTTNNVSNKLKKVNDSYAKELNDAKTSNHNNKQFGLKTKHTKKSIPETSNVKKQEIKDKHSDTNKLNPNTSTILTASEQSVGSSLATNKHMASEPLATREQNVSNSLAASEHIVSEPLAAREQNVSNSLAASEHMVSEPLAASEQSVSRSVSKNLLYWLSTLSGKEKELVDTIYHLCKTQCSLETQIIPTNYLLTELNISSNHLRNLFNRVSRKDILAVISSKGGLGAGRIVLLAKEAYAYYQKKEDKNYPLAHPLAASNVVSSNINNTNTYLGESLPEEWGIIDIAPLKEVGVSRSHLLQLYQDYRKQPEFSLSPDTINNSILSFAYDYTHNKNAMQIRTSPIGKLMGCLKQGRPYTSITPDKVKSPQQIALEKYKEAQEAAMRKKEELVEAIKAMERKNWFSKLSEEEIKTIGAQTNSRLKKDSIDENKFEIKIYFAKEIWPTIENKLRKENVIID